MMMLRLASTPPLRVAAAAVVCSWYTTHGWRPTSVTTQPHSMATIAARPLTAPSSQNSRCDGSRRCRHHAYSAHSPASNSKNPRPTMASKHRWISHTTGGRHAIPAGNLRAGAEPDQQRIHVRDLQPRINVPVDIHPGQPLRDLPGSLRHVLHGRELH